ncbi:MAG: trypsin-like peptidase domain-containing protein, partial [Oscillospiraceae bacterium]
MNNLNSDEKNNINENNENNENSVNNENQTPPVFNSNNSDPASENPDNQQGDMNTNPYTNQERTSTQYNQNQNSYNNTPDYSRYNYYNAANNYAKYNGNNYQPPKYNSFYGNKNQENIPPYQDPKNYYHSGKNNTNNFQQENNDTYKWNLDDYKSPTENSSVPKRKKSKGLYVFLSMVAIVIGISVIGLAGYGIYALSIGQSIIDESSQTDSASSSPDTVMPNVSIKNKPDVTESTSSDGTLSSVEIAKKVKPSVVGIQSYSAAGFGVQSEGSGIIMSADGYIITNAHVVDGSEGIKVILDNDEAFSAKVIGLDIQSDIAVIKVDAENLTYADFGNSDQLEVGERVLAIGNP